jgi:tetratricopeptide (TPR) repeat protein
MQAHLSGPGRSIRVFVSSTFRDMVSERDELVKQVFPALRHLAESRGVTWAAVDLRWGVTKNQKEEGELLSICLKEVDRCRPYFIGLLGERYGTVPDKFEAKAVQLYPWIKDHPGASFTELEIVHGVFNDPDPTGPSFIYLRDPLYLEGRPAETYREVPTPEEIGVLGSVEAESRAADRRGRLAALKSSLQRTHRVEHYADPRSLGERILADFTEVIEARFPTESVPDSMEREAAEHEAFANSKAAVYIARASYTRHLDAHAAADGPPLVITGESGAGKSALLANWALKYREANPNTAVIQHFAGASPVSTDAAAMLRRLMRELSRHFGLAIEVPSDPHKLRLAFVNALHMAAAKGKVVLIIDALDQLEDRQGALDLVWLPREIPANVRLLLSTLPGRPADALADRGWKTLTVKPLRPAERAALIDAYLHQYGKTLDKEPRARLAAAAQAANPLYVRVLLDELCASGSMAINELMAHYLASPDPAALLDLVLARYEEDYERDRPGLVRDALTAIWASRQGLGEAELLDLLGTPGSPLPQAIWLPLYYPAAAALVIRAGRLGFFHQHMRSAVERRYVPSDDARRAAHRVLADYFSSRAIGPRKVVELPWQLTRSCEWDRLASLLGDLAFFDAAWDADDEDVRAAWAQVEANSNHRVLDAYRAVLDHPAAHEVDTTAGVSTLMSLMGHPEEALALRRHIVARCQAVGGAVDLATALLNQGIALADLGRWEAAGPDLREAERLFRGLGNLADQARALGALGRTESAKGRPTRAAFFFTQSEPLLRKIGDPAGIAANLEDQAMVCFDRGQLEKAKALLVEAIGIGLARGDRQGQAHRLMHLGLILNSEGALDDALARFSESEAISRDLGDQRGIAAGLGNRGVILKNRGVLDAAMAAFQDQQRIDRLINDRAGIARSLGNQGDVHRLAGRPEEALACLRECQAISQDIGQMETLALSLANQAVVLEHPLRRYVEALGLIEEAYGIASGAGLARLAQQFLPQLATLQVVVANQEGRVTQETR